MIEPDLWQRRVIEAPLGERRIVIAGPGNGKTSTAIQLIRSISRRIEDDGVAVLYVSFSRAAMSAAFNTFGRSLSEVLGDRLDVLPMTLDSLAWQLTEEVRTGNEEAPDFDLIVESAIGLLETEYSGQFDHIVHMIVDEAQDLSLPRRVLLCKIIERLPANAGLTIFGDPLQSIFEFLDMDAEKPVSAWGHLIESLSALSVNINYTLETNYRAKRSAPRSVAAIGSELRLAPRSARSELLDELFAGYSSWDLDEFIDRSSGWKGSTAVLARSNSECMFLFGELTSRGIECTVRLPGALGNPVAAWLARLWKAVEGAPLTMDAFMLFADNHTDVEPEWFRLLLAESEHAGKVDWVGLARSLRVAADPMSPWFRRMGLGVTVSTIHQSKGLEWDNVGIIKCRELVASVGARGPEPELAFVAASRARERIVNVQVRAPFARKAKLSGVIYSSHPATHRPTAIGIDPSAIDREFVGGAKGQQVLAVSATNAMMEFELLATGLSEWPVYRCVVDGAAVGVTSARFGKALAGLVSSTRGKWPELGPVRLDGCETEWKTVGETRFWLKPRPFGMSTIS